MIFDECRNFQKYAALAPEVWAKVTEFLKNTDADTAIGRYEIDGNRVFASVQHYPTHPADVTKLEYHRKYADIQLLLGGHESILVSPLEGLNETLPYDETHDIGFCEIHSNDVLTLPLAVGNFALLLPEEGHMPGVGVPETDVIKVVIKIEASLLKA